MKNILIGKLLKLLTESYEAGECDDLTKSEEEEITNKISNILSDLLLKQDKVWTIEEVSLHIGITRQTVHNYVKLGYLHPKKHLGGVLEFKVKEVMKLKKLHLSKL